MHALERWHNSYQHLYLSIARDPIMSEIDKHQDALADILSKSPIIPVVAVADAEQALALATALVEGGLSTIEVTLRTPGALAGIAAIRKAMPRVRLGAGTVLQASQMRQVAEIGCDFAVSPGTTSTLIQASLASDMPLLGGATSATETQLLLEQGLRYQKFFPAEQSGGIDYLKALYGPLPEASFCPTGGINMHNAASYLACPNVISVGGGWVAPAAAIASEDWEQVSKLCAQALASISSIH
jgi:2-dehydro-3-deoxyphosphogluconate aldolase/(4S)-4-hydroxy-2-oxoglutarate aldolase